MPTGDNVAHDLTVQSNKEFFEQQLRRAEYQANKWEEIAHNIDRQLTQERRKVADLIGIINETSELRKALTAIRIPIEQLARHAGRCAATEICDDHLQMQTLARAMYRHIAHFHDHHDLQHFHDHHDLQEAADA